MTDNFDRRLARAAELASIRSESRDLLLFYHDLLQIQRRIFADLEATHQTDVVALPGWFPEILEFVIRQGPAPLIAFGKEHLRGPAEREELLKRFWEGTESGDDSEPAKFFARALLQPYAEYLASRGSPDLDSTRTECPFCSARPVLAVLRREGDGSRRSLLCSLCATEWHFRRIVCPHCGESDMDKLPTYSADDPGYVSINACDTCKTWIKAIDLTKNGLAIPVVDDLATPALNMWAEEQGYSRLETNILGF